jgi:hypothetical protein
MPDLFEYNYGRRLIGYGLNCPEDTEVVIYPHLRGTEGKSSRQVFDKNTGAYKQPLLKRLNPLRQTETIYSVPRIYVVAALALRVDMSIFLENLCDKGNKPESIGKEIYSDSCSIYVSPLGIDFQPDRNDCGIRNAFHPGSPHKLR